MKVTHNISNEALKEKTSKDWQQWIETLDKDNVSKMNHTELAAHLRNKHNIDPWWAQSIANGYEKEKGLRVKHEKAEGVFEISKTKVFDTELPKLFEIVNNLIEKNFFGKIEITTLNKNKNIRLKSKKDETAFSFDFYPKENKTQLAIQHFKIKNAEQAEEFKEFWANKLKDIEKEITK